MAIISNYGIRLPVDVKIVILSQDALFWGSLPALALLFAIQKQKLYHHHCMIAFPGCLMNQCCRAADREASLGRMYPSAEISFRCDELDFKSAVYTQKIQIAESAGGNVRVAVLSVF